MKHIQYRATHTWKDTPETFEIYREANVAQSHKNLTLLTNSWRQWIQHAQWNEQTQTLEYAGRTSQYFFDRLSKITQEAIEDEN